MTSQKLKRLMLALIKCSELTRINLSKNALNCQMIEILLHQFPQLPHLTKLNISTGALSPDCVLLLASSINACDRITDVDVRSPESICLHLQRQQKASKVSCRFNNCNIGTNDITNLMKILQQNPRLFEVSMCSNQLSEDGVLQLLFSIRNVAEINASLNPNEVIHIVFSSSGDSVRKIRLSGYNFHADHLKKLCALLENTEHVNHIKLKRNCISLEAMKEILTVQLRKPHSFTLSIDEAWVGGEPLMSLFHHLLNIPSRLQCISVFQSKLTIDVNSADSRDESDAAMLSFQALKSLRFNECSLEIEKLESLDLLIKHSANLTELSFSRIMLSDTGVHIISGFLASLPALRIIKLAFVNMSQVGVMHLTESLQHCESIQVIDLSNNAIGEEGAKYLTHLLTQKRNLHAINVCGCGFSTASEEGKQFISELSKCLNLQEINLQDMSLDDDSLLVLCQALPQMLLIRKLVLSCNGIGDLSMEKLAESLPSIKSLRKIKLSQCSISSMGGLKLTEALKQCPLMEEIDLSGNNFENKAGCHLFASLSQLQQLQLLHLRSCGLGVKSESALMEALGSCEQMEDISLSENTFSEPFLLKLAERLPYFRMLRKLDLKLCGISDSVCKSLAEVLGCCQNLEEIILSWNRIGDDGSCALSYSLNQMRRLKKLDLEKNQIKMKGVQAMAQALSVCLWIKVICLWGNLVTKEEGEKLHKENARLSF